MMVDRITNSGIILLYLPELVQVKFMVNQSSKIMISNGEPYDPELVFALFNQLSLV